LLKINFDINPNAEIIKNYSLKNCKIARIDKKEDYKFFTRFTFLTVFQYLNEREQIMNSLYVKDGEVIDFYLTSYDVGEGKEQNFSKDEIKKDYELAKEKLKSLIEYKTNKISDNLNEFLKKEKERISKHYSVQINEIDLRLKEIQNNIDFLEKSKKPDKVKIEKLKNLIKDIKAKGDVEKLKKEESFFINDEIQKHSLNIQNKLMNTTLIYYPIFKYQVLLEGIGKKLINISYNPLIREFDNVCCDSCDNEVKEFILCSSGHLTCRECGSKCSSCDGIYCKKCSVNKCFICNRQICSKCFVKCDCCRQGFCKSHLKEFGKKRFCINCIERCSKCGCDVEPGFLINKVCEKCNSKSVGKEILKNVFKNEW